MTPAAERANVSEVTYLLLGLAIVLEVSGTLALRQTDGFSRPVPSLIVAVCYVLAFVLLSLVLQRGLSVAIAYALWSAAGIFLIAAIGWLFFDEGLTVLQGAGLALIVCGVIVTSLGTSASPA
jgi:small multidrug resistance pump